MDRGSSRWLCRWADLKKERNSQRRTTTIPSFLFARRGLNMPCTFATLSHQTSLAHNHLSWASSEQAQTARTAGVPICSLYSTKISSTAEKTRSTGQEKKSLGRPVQGEDVHLQEPEGDISDQGGLSDVDLGVQAPAGDEGHIGFREAPAPCQILGGRLEEVQDHELGAPWPEGVQVQLAALGCPAPETIELCS